jgi:hypothetical protein
MNNDKYIIISDNFCVPFELSNRNTIAGCADFDDSSDDFTNASIKIWNEDRNLIQENLKFLEKV